MEKQDKYIKEKKLQSELDGVSEFIPNVVIAFKNNIRIVTNNYTIKHNGGDRFGLYLEKVLLQEKDYLIAKVKAMSTKDLGIERQSAVNEADNFVHDNK